jgi:hypothetical protein
MPSKIRAGSLCACRGGCKRIAIFTAPLLHNGWRLCKLRALAMQTADPFPILFRRAPVRACGHLCF